MAYPKQENINPLYLMRKESKYTCKQLAEILAISAARVIQITRPYNYCLNHYNRDFTRLKRAIDFLNDRNG